MLCCVVFFVPLCFTCTVFCCNVLCCAVLCFTLPKGNIFFGFCWCLQFSVHSSDVILKVVKSSFDFCFKVAKSFLELEVHGLGSLWCLVQQRQDACIAFCMCGWEEKSLELQLTHIVRQTNCNLQHYISILIKHESCVCVCLFTFSEATKSPTFIWSLYGPVLKINPFSAAGMPRGICYRMLL